VVCGGGTTCIFPKKQKKGKKMDFELLSKAQITFSCKIKYTTHLRIFFSTNETKMKKIGDYDHFFDFFIFQSKRWVGVKKKCHNSKTGGNLQAGNFLKY
jgi:hypothetical protein